MEQENPGLLQKIIGISIFSIVMLLIGYVALERILLTKNHRYTIGTTEGSRSTDRGKRIDFFYEVDGTKYRSSRHPDGFSPISKNGRYFVMYNPDRPIVGIIMWDKPVPEHIKEAPSEGWEKIPQ